MFVMKTGHRVAFLEIKIQKHFGMRYVITRKFQLWLTFKHWALKTSERPF